MFYDLFMLFNLYIWVVAGVVIGIPLWWACLLLNAPEIRKELKAFLRLSLMFLLVAAGTCNAEPTANDLQTLIYGFEDARINGQDLAFYLATHDFNAIPRGDNCVEVTINQTVFSLVPNGEKPGLADYI